MEYTPAVLQINKNGDWYVRWQSRDPKTGELEPKKERAGINRIKNLKERKKHGLALAQAINNKLAAGWSPFIQPKKENERLVDFYYWFEQRLEYSKKMHGYYNHRKLKSVMDNLKLFAPVLKVKDLNFTFVKKYEVYLKEERNNSPNYIADIMMRLGIVMGEIEKDGDITYKQNPFHNAKFQTERVIKERLTHKQVEKLKAARLKNPKEKLARDMYVLSYYCAGIRFGDLCRLKPENFKGGRLVYEMGKSKLKHKVRNIVLVDAAKDILRKYSKGKERLFPLNVDWENEERSIDGMNGVMNKHLKNACWAAGVPEITFHTSRNSFADSAVKKKTGTRQLKELFGHSKERTTEIYMADFYEEETDEALKNVFK